MSNQNCQIFVDGLNCDTTDESFLTHFTNFGKVKFHRIFRDQDGRSLGCGIIEYVSAPLAEAALSVKCHYIGGRRIQCSKRQRAEKCGIVEYYKNFNENDLPKHLRKIFIGNLAPVVTIKHLKNYFVKFGDLDDVFIAKNKNQKSKCFGFVTFRKIAIVDEVQNKRPHVIENQEVRTVRSYPHNTLNNEEKPSTVLHVLNQKELCVNEVEKYFSRFGLIIRISQNSVKNSEFIVLEFDDYDDVDKICLIGIHCVENRILIIKKHHEMNSNKNTETNIDHSQKNHSEQASSYCQSAEQSTWNCQITPSAPPPLDYYCNDINSYYAPLPQIFTLPLPQNLSTSSLISDMQADELNNSKTCYGNIIASIILVSLFIIILCCLVFA